MSTEVTVTEITIPRHTDTTILVHAVTEHGDEIVIPTNDHDFLEWSGKHARPRFKAGDRITINIEPLTLPTPPESSMVAGETEAHIDSVINKIPEN